MKKILIVEDSVLIQKIIQDALESCFPCHVKAVEDGAQAYDELAQNSYDLVISDIVMPVMDGLTLAEKVRVELESDVPIIMLTSLGVKNVRDSTSASGVNAYLNKPIDVQQLTRVVNRLFPSQNPAPEVAAPPPDMETPGQTVEAPQPAAVTAVPEDDEASLPEIEEWTSKIDEDW